MFASMGTQRGGAISLSDGNVRFLEFDFNPGRCPPDSECQNVTPAITAHDLERWRGVRELSVSRYGGNPPVCAAIT